MKAGREVVIMDPYEWLPDYGETSVSVTQSEGEVSVLVTYDGPDTLAQKEILFKGACALYTSPFPGPQLLAVGSLTSASSLLPLVEYLDSEAAAAMAEHYKSYASWDRLVRHFRIFFHSANMAVTVFASEVLVRDRDPVLADAQRLQ